MLNDNWDRPFVAEFGNDQQEEDKMVVMKLLTNKNVLEYLRSPSPGLVFTSTPCGLFWHT
jgi:hypothetical protein